MHKQDNIMVNGSLPPACTGGLNIVHVGSKKSPKMRTMVVRANVAHVLPGPDYVLNLDSSPLCPTYLLGVDQTFPDLGMVGFTSKHMIWDVSQSPTRRRWYAQPKWSYWLGLRYFGH